MSAPATPQDALQLFLETQRKAREELQKLTQSTRQLRNELRRDASKPSNADETGKQKPL